MTKRIPVLLVVAVLVSSAACTSVPAAPSAPSASSGSPVPNAVKFELSCDDFSKSPNNGVISPREEVAVNGTITVILCSNAST